MKIRTYDPNAGAGGGGNPGTSGSTLLGNSGNQPPAGAPVSDWRTGLPEDLRSEKVFESIKGKDWNEAGPVLAKSYVNAQRLVGADKIAKPSANWTPDQWNEFYSATGRPPKPEDYEIKVPDGMTVPAEELTAWRKELFDLGLSKAQVAKLTDKFYASEGARMKATQDSAQAQIQTWENEIKAEFGDKFDENVNFARFAIKEFGNQNLMKLLDSSGFGSHPEVVKFFATVGRKLADSGTIGGANSSANAGRLTPENAQASLAVFHRDPENMKALMNADHPNHDAVVAERAKLFMAAYPRGTDEKND